MLATSSPFSFILFGASGHLAKLKLYPALYTLALKKRLPEEYNIVGFARSEMSEDAFRTLVADAIKKDMIEVNDKVLKEFLSHVHYCQGQYDAKEDYATLRTLLETLEKGWSDPIRVAYLSIPPTVFPPVLMNLCGSGVYHEKGKFRCIVEKPVGSDLGSAEQIHAELCSCFAEPDVYLLDHYLGKEAVRNAYYLRFANPLLERLFKNTLIDHVQITASEPAGIEGRAGYFEYSGTFRDMFQSHLLMISSLLTMRLVEKDENFQSVRLDALKQFYLPPAKSLDEIALQGQYDTYQKEDGVAKNSRTNTYAALKLMTRISRWQGVPFYLHSGKKLAKKETRISIQFQEPRPVGKGAKPNRLDIILQGEAGMRMHLQTKIGGTEPEFRPLILTDPLVCVGDCLPEHGILILEAIHGKTPWYLSFEEVRTSWRLIDPVQSHFDDPETPLFPYASGSTGPTESAAWMKRDGKEWY